MLLSSVALIGLFLGVQALPRQAPLPSTPSKAACHRSDALKRLTFDQDGKFKLAVFSDLHYGERDGLDWVQWGEDQDVNSTRVMDNVLNSESPDFVVFNGDLVTGENLFLSNGTSYLPRALSSTISHSTPFASIYGNHDRSTNISHSALYAAEKSLCSARGLSYTLRNPSSADDEDGQFNYVLEVFSHRKKEQQAPELLLWMFDSRSGIFDDASMYWDWVDPKAAEWINSTSSSILRRYPSLGKTLPPSLIFVHIPPSVALPLQASEVSNNASYPGINDDDPLDPQGQHHPELQRPDQVWWEAVKGTIAREGGEGLIASVSGHDHGNDWCARSSSVETTICFARHSGYGGYGSRPRGSRIFEISQLGAKGRSARSSGRSLEVESWIRLEDGAVANLTGIY
ncbi:Metallo-dependent phosphatase-like protein [Leucosporidium creatinivorum]|uniref:Metallo-dependent phosphatase-like protein n=1 Tax=Leucosporidium creatinivorum TaxID=106004 RepID=A0A1Y2G064_9BASI|nr:Metallo-dependent phosphatase-like protein [Leucosporidium creatinivorum]